MNFDIAMMKLHIRTLEDRRSRQAHREHAFAELETLYRKHCANNGGDLKIANLNVRDCLKKYRESCGC